MKYATVAVFTAPTFSINLTYPRKAIPVEMTPSHSIEKIALLEGNCEGKLKMVNGRRMIDASTRDQPIKTIVFVLYANF